MKHQNISRCSKTFLICWKKALKNTIKWLQNTVALETASETHSGIKYHHKTEATAIFKSKIK